MIIYYLMEELIEYDFPYNILLVGKDDYNDKFCKLYLNK